MRKWPPPFPVVLSALLAGAGIAVLLLAGGPSSSGAPPTLGIGSLHACAATRAEAEVTAQSEIVVNQTTRAPVSVTESATGPNGIATASRSEVVIAHFRLTRPVSVKRTAPARATACADAGSVPAARRIALRRAYAQALVAAHAAAAREAEAELRALVHRLFPSVVAEARVRSSARAHRLAVAEGQALALQTIADARRRAGG